MKKKILAFALVVAMLAIAVVGGTLAYFTDEDEATNVFTVGNVDITLYESKLHRLGYYSDGATNGQEQSDDAIIADAAEYQDWLEDQELMPGIEINKMPYVKNTGKSDAYVRIRVMIPSALDLDCLNSSAFCSTALEEEFTFTGNWATPVTATVNGVQFDVYEFVRNEALEGGEMTYWNVWNTIRMDNDTTMDDYNAYLAAGAITADGQFNVIVQADAIQAASFDNATEAFAAFDAQQ